MKRKKSTFLGINLQDRNTLATIRIAGYGLMLAAAAAIAFVLVATANGYDINRQTGEVIQNGLILVDSDPAADIFVDGVDEQDRTPGRLPLPAGMHTVRLQRDGYFEWTKQIDLGGSEVEWLYYPRLFPQDISSTLLQTYDTFSDAQQSPDRRWVLIHQDKTKPTFQLIDTENILDAARTITIPSSLIPTITDEVVEYEIIEWSGSNRHFLVKQTVASSTQYFVVDRATIANSVNVSQLVSLDLTDVHFRGERGNILYAMVDSTVREINLDDGAVSAPLLRNVVQYTPNGDNRLLFVREADATDLYEVGIYKDEETFIVSQVTNSDAEYFLLLDTYDDDQYFSVASSQSETVRIYRNVEDTSAEALQPFTTIKTQSPVDSLSMSLNKQFVLVQADDRIVSYDIEDTQRVGFQIDEKLDGLSQIQWLDGHRFVVSAADGKIVTYEFDGANRVELGENSNREVLPMFDRNIEQMYLFNPVPTNEKTVLTQYQLVLDN